MPIHKALEPTQNRVKKRMKTETTDLTFQYGRNANVLETKEALPNYHNYQVKISMTQNKMIKIVEIPTIQTLLVSI